MYWFSQYPLLISPWLPTGRTNPHKWNHQTTWWNADKGSTKPWPCICSSWGPNNSYCGPSFGASSQKKGDAAGFALALSPSSQTSRSRDAHRAPTQDWRVEPWINAEGSYTSLVHCFEILCSFHGTPIYLFWWVNKEKLPYLPVLGNLAVICCICTLK